MSSRSSSSYESSNGSCYLPAGAPYASPEAIFGSLDEMEQSVYPSLDIIKRQL